MDGEKDLVPGMTLGHLRDPVGPLVGARLVGHITTRTYWELAGKARWEGPNALPLTIGPLRGQPLFDLPSP